MSHADYQSGFRAALREAERVARAEQADLDRTAAGYRIPSIQPDDRTAELHEQAAIAVGRAADKIAAIAVPEEED